VRQRRDRRIERTRQLLREALVSLIRERGFETLTVQDILDRANVGRATFYSHFENKDDLLVSGFEELRASLKGRQRDAFTRGRTLEERLLGFSRDVFAQTHEYRDAFKAMVGRRSGAIVQRLLHKLVVELVREDVKRMDVRVEGSTAHAEALVHFIAGALVGVLMWWLDGRMRLSIDDVDAHFRRLALPALKAACG
jgi:AcrR family transcriptional regulator